MKRALKKIKEAQIKAEEQALKRFKREQRLMALQKKKEKAEAKKNKKLKRTQPPEPAPAPTPAPE